MRQLATIALAVTATFLWAAPAVAQFAQQGPKLVGTSGVNPSFQGSAAALSADGNTAIVSGNGDDGYKGAVWIFTRSGGTWAQQGPKLLGTGSAGPAYQGFSAALSADGNTGLVGGINDNSGAGAAWVFTRDGAGTWTQQGPKLVGTGAVEAGAGQGWAVALSADGNTAVVSSPGDNVSTGAVWIFARSGTGWSQQGPKLVGTGAVGLSSQGAAVAISADGNTLLVGGDGDNGNTGAAWVFSRDSGGTWTQQAGKLTGAGGIGSSQFGGSVALSADGNTAVVGGPGDNTLVGAVWVFTRNGTSWTQQGGKLVGTGWASSAGPYPLVYQGHRVSVSGTGNMLIEGGYFDNNGVGATWVFTRDGNTWSQQGGKIVGSGAAGIAGQGSAVSLAADGLTAIVGGYGDNSGLGAAWVFTQTTGLPLPHAIGDADGDRRADATVLKANGDWASAVSSGGFTAAVTVNFAASTGFTPVRGDFDGDGRQDPAYYNRGTGEWIINTSSSGFATVLHVTWGGGDYAPAPGDYDGDGKADIAVYDVSAGTWLILTSRSGYAGTMHATLGHPGDIPIGGQDFDGDGVSDFAVYAPATGVWSVLRSSTAFTTGFSVGWGGRGFTLVPGDYDGDRRADLAVYERATGAWYILKSSAGFTTSMTLNWGGPGYLPVPGDYDGDGRFDAGAFQQSTGNWYVLKSSSNYTTTLTVGEWGSSGDLPLSSAIVAGLSDALRATDTDADVRSDLTVYNATSGVWSSLTSSTTYTGATNRAWGGLSYAPAPGDYDGDGRMDLGLYLPSSNTFYALLSGRDFTTTRTLPLYLDPGGSGWSPAPGDYDGDGTTDVAVHDPISGLWRYRLSGESFLFDRPITYGTGVAVPGDYDGDGKTDFATYDGTTGKWSIRLSSTNGASSLVKFAGGPGWIPVPGDYDGDGKADLVVYNATTGQWHGVLSSAAFTTTISVSWGGAGYTPVKGDYDGDGRTDLAVYQPSTGYWYILLSTSGYTTTLVKNWGGPGYLAASQYP